MYLNNNIKYLRKLKNWSQDKFAQHLGLNRGNVASYELSTTPPIEIMLKICDIFNISTDALIKNDLTTLQFPDSPKSNEFADSRRDLGERMDELLHYLEIDANTFAKKLKISSSDLIQIMNGSRSLPFDALVILSKNYSWISLEWLVRGSGSMIGDASYQLSKVAEPGIQMFNHPTDSFKIESLIRKILKRLDNIEKELGK